jgi:hypothetical protein
MKKIIHILLSVAISCLLTPDTYTKPVQNPQQLTMQVTENDYIQMLKAIFEEENKRLSALALKKTIFIVTSKSKQYPLPVFRNIKAVPVTIEDVRNILKKDRFIECIDLTRTEIQYNTVVISLATYSLRKDSSFPVRDSRIYEFKQKHSFWAIVSTRYSSADYHRYY